MRNFLTIFIISLVLLIGTSVYAQKIGGGGGAPMCPPGGDDGPGGCRDRGFLSGRGSGAGLERTSLMSFFFKRPGPCP